MPTYGTRLNSELRYVRARWLNAAPTDHDARSRAGERALRVGGWTVRMIFDTLTSRMRSQRTIPPTTVCVGARCSCGYRHRTLAPRYEMMARFPRRVMRLCEPGLLTIYVRLQLGGAFFYYGAPPPVPRLHDRAAPMFLSCHTCTLISACDFPNTHSVLDTV